MLRLLSLPSRQDYRYQYLRLSGQIAHSTSQHQAFSAFVIGAMSCAHIGEFFSWPKLRRSTSIAYDWLRTSWRVLLIRVSRWQSFQGIAPLRV